MSRFTTEATSSIGFCKLFTYSLEPNSPASSPAQNAKRTVRCGWTPSFRA